MSSTSCRRFILCMGLGALGYVGPNRDALAEQPFWRWEQQDLRQIGLSLHFEVKRGLRFDCDAADELRSALTLFYHYDIISDVPPGLSRLPLPYTIIDVVLERRSRHLLSTIRFIDEKNMDFRKIEMEHEPTTKCSKLMRVLVSEIVRINKLFAPALPDPSEDEPPGNPCKKEKKSPRRLPPPPPSSPIPPVMPSMPPSISVLPPRPPKEPYPQTRYEFGIFMGVAPPSNTHKTNTLQGLLLRRERFGLELGLRVPWNPAPALPGAALFGTLVACPIEEGPFESCLFLRAAWDHQSMETEAPGIRVAYTFQSEWPFSDRIISYRFFMDAQPKHHNEGLPWVVGASIATDFTLERSSQ